jgi:hypothetical protein
MGQSGIHDCFFYKIVDIDGTKSQISILAFPRPISEIHFLFQRFSSSYISFNHFLEHIFIPTLLSSFFFCENTLEVISVEA